MAKTETNVSTLKINRGTYAKVQENLSSITENELIITSDKNVPIPTTNDNGKAVVVNASGEYELGNAGMSQSDADARYLQLSGGTMNGNIKLGTSNKWILTSNSEAVVGVDANGRTCIGSSSPVYLRTMAGNSIFHSVGATDYTVLDANNTSANPTLSGGETTLSSLKLNGTNYAVPTPHTINTYTLGALSEADQAKIAEDIAQGYPIKVGNTVYELFSDTQYWVYWLSRVDGTYTRGDYNKVSYSKTNHQLSTNSGNDNILFSSDILSSLPISNGLTINGHTRKLATDSIGFSTTAPTADNTSGYLDIRVLTSEPATRFNGYWYIILSSSNNGNGGGGAN